MIAAREAYRLWAPTYDDETVISLLDQEVTAALSPAVAGRRLLDAGCGTGRRLPAAAALAVGIDFSPEMLAAGGRSCVAAADVRALPFTGAAFDLAWCRLALGHIANVAKAYRELARILTPGGMLLITDFHPRAAAAGHRRSFRDNHGSCHEIEHYLHDHPALAEAARLKPVAAQDGVVGAAVESLYRRAGRDAAFEEQRGQAFVAGFLFAKPCD